MRKPRRDPARNPAYLADMLRAAEAVQLFVRDRTRDEYTADLLLRC